MILFHNGIIATSILVNLYIKKCDISKTNVTNFTIEKKITIENFEQAFNR